MTPSTDPHEATAPAGPFQVHADRPSAVSAWVALGALFLFTHGVESLYWLFSAPPPSGFRLLSPLLTLLLLWRWLEQECRPYHPKYPLDILLFLSLIAFLLIPYYMWRYQRWKGLLKIAGLVAMWGAAWVLPAGGVWLLAFVRGE